MFWGISLGTASPVPAGCHRCHSFGERPAGNDNQTQSTRCGWLQMWGFTPPGVSESNPKSWGHLGSQESCGHPKAARPCCSFCGREKTLLLLPVLGKKIRKMKLSEGNICALTQTQKGPGETGLGRSQVGAIFWVYWQTTPLHVTCPRTASSSKYGLNPCIMH